MRLTIAAGTADTMSMQRTTDRPLDAAMLKKVPLFAEFSDADLAAVSSLMQGRRYAKHAVLVYEGDPGDALFIVISGNVARGADNSSNGIGQSGGIDLETGTLVVSNTIFSGGSSVIPSICERSRTSRCSSVWR